MCAFLSFAASSASASTSTWADLKAGKVFIDRSVDPAPVVHKVWRAGLLDNGMLPLVYHRTRLEDSTLASLLEDISDYGVEPLYKETGSGWMLVEFEGEVAFRSDGVETFLLAYTRSSLSDKYTIWSGNLGRADWEFDSRDVLPQNTEVVWVASSESIIFQEQITISPLGGWERLL